MLADWPVVPCQLPAPKTLNHSVVVVAAAVVTVVAAAVAAVVAAAAARMKLVMVVVVVMEADQTVGCCPCLYCLPESNSE